MSQTAMTIRLDETTKKEFTKLCDDFGLSVNAAINIFIKAVINTGEIPFRIGRKRDSLVYQNAITSWTNIRQRAENSALPEMTLEEINAEIQQARSERNN